MYVETHTEAGKTEMKLLFNYKGNY